MQTRACWYRSVVTLAGLVLKAVALRWWADPVAALGISVLLVREGLEAISGEEEQAGEDSDGEASDGDRAVRIAVNGVDADSPS